MLVFGDLNLNQFGGSVKMALKRTIVQHELIFKDQVHELHRLYWVQKNLMRELYRNELEAKVLYQSRMVGSMKEGNVGSLEVAKGKFVDVGDNGQRGFIPVSVKHSIVDEMIRSGYSGSKEVTIEKGGGMIDKGENLYCYEVIDLEGPVDINFKVPTENCGVMGSSPSDNVSDVASFSRVQNVPRFVLDLNSSHMDCSESWREQKADDHSGIGGSESSAAGVVDVSTDSSHEEPNSSKPMLIDLNLPQDDESSHVVDDPLMTYSSPSSSSSVVLNEVLWRDQCNRNFKENPATLNSEAPYSASTGSTDCLLAGQEDSQRSQVSDFGGNQEYQVEGSNLKGLTGCCRITVEGLPNNVEVDNNSREERADNNATIEEGGPDENFLMERKSDGLSGDTACTSSDQIMEEKSKTTQLDDNSSVEEKACKHDDDHAVIGAANILAGISITHRSSQVEQLFDDKNDQPEYSSDTFETMTLELPEVRSHEQPFIMPGRHTGKGKEEEGEIAAGRVNNRIRRARGRAARDFQRDVLPGMVSLARHEICKDMHSIGYELGKKGSRRGNGFVPVTSGRSRSHLARRRH